MHDSILQRLYSPSILACDKQSALDCCYKQWAICSVLAHM